MAALLVDYSPALRAMERSSVAKNEAKLFMTQAIAHMVLAATALEIMGQQKERDAAEDLLDAMQALRKRL